MSQPTYLPDADGVEGQESPRHGFRGESGPPKKRSAWPKSLSLAVTREAGARGGTIAARVGRRLGWQVFSQELMEYMAQEEKLGTGLFDPLPTDANQWITDRLDQLMREQNLSRNPTIVDLARVVLTLGVQGEVILLGRGAGCILPSPTTLHVRLVAPLPDRIAYMGQWLRLTEAEATEQVRKRDSRRADFISTHFHRRPSDVHQYDLVLNTSFLGEERCTDMIVHAAKLKLAGLGVDAD